MRISDWSSDVCSSDLWNQTVGPVKLSAGGFWLRNRTHYNYGIALAVLPEALGYFVSIPVLGDFNQTRIGYGGFASATYSMSDEFRLKAGGRAPRDRRTAAGQGAAGTVTRAEERRAGREGVGTRRNRTSADA